nr:EOG090X0J5E [Triops cancriformis]
MGERRCAKYLSTQPVYYKTLSETTSVTTLFNRTTLFSNPSASIVLNKAAIAPPSVTSVRPVVKFSLKKGKRKSVKAVVKRFYRLDWGAWIRPIVGRNKKAWRKNYRMRQRAKQHVFCNSTQSTLLDKMVTSFWRRPRHYVDDPYEPYHTRTELYYTGVSGNIRSFNYDPNTGRQLSNQFYSICIRPEENFCGIAYSVCNGGGSIRPFQISVNFDNNENSTVPAQVNNRGFCLSYIQQPCTA